MAQHHPAHAEGAPHAHPLHFSHPLIGESVSPGTEAGLEHAREGASVVTELSLGYALSRGFGIDVGLPFLTLPDGELELGAPHLGLHFAHFGLADHGILLGYGVEMSLQGPEPSEASSEHAHDPLQPFLSLGYKSGALELIASAQLGLGSGTRAAGAEEPHADAAHHSHEEPGHGGAGRRIGYNLSALHAFSPRVQGLLEVYGARTGGPDGQGGTALRFAPGVRVHLIPGVSLSLGASGPLRSTERNPIRTSVSATYHW